MASKKFLTPVNLLNLSEDPATGAQGDLYFNTASQKLRKYTSSGWEDVEASASSGVIDISSEVPETPVLGRAWFDNESGSFYVYDGTYWVQINGVFENPPYNEEQVFDSAAALLEHSNHLNVTAVYDDNNDQVLLSVSGDITSIDSITYPDYITFDTTPDTEPSDPGSLWWSTDFETLSLQLDSGVDLQIGQEHLVRVKNNSGSVAIPKGTAVMFAGAAGDTVKAAPAVSTAQSEPEFLIGVTAEIIPADGFGFVTQFGFINGTNTETPGWSLGNLLYIDPVNPGQLTNVKPSAPNWTFPVAAVTRIGVGSGRILVRAIPGIHLHDLVDVAIVSELEDQVLRYDDQSGTWKNTHPNIVTARNVTEDTISAFTPVYINTQEFEQDNITFAPADASSSMYLAKLPADAITVEDVDSDDYTKLVTMGTVTGADLTGYNVGQNLYVAVGGGLTGTRPTGNNAIQPFARVLSVDNGTMYVYGNTFVSSIDNLPNLGSDKVWLGTSGRPVETTLSTSVVSEGTNLYYTDERAQDAAAEMFLDGAHNGISVEYVDESSLFNLTNTGVTSVYGTANEIEVSSATGSATISFPESVILPSDTAIGSVSAEEIYFLEGATENIQNQIDNKTDIGHLHNTNDIELFEDAVRETMDVAFSGGDNINISVTYDSETGTFTFVGAETYNDEMAQNAAAEAIVNATHSGISVDYDQENYLLSFSNDGVLSVTGTEDQVQVSNLDGSVTVGLPDDVTITNDLSVGGDLTLTNSPTQSLHAATKQYVDETAQGLSVKPSTHAATTEDLSAVYDNGVDGVGATLTATANGEWVGSDGVESGWDIFNSILVKDQTNKEENGRYYISDYGSLTTPWVLTRCIYCDTSDEIPGSYIFVTDGTIYGGTGWTAIVDNPSTFEIGTDDISYIQFSGAGVITAGSNIEINGNEISVVEAPIFNGLSVSDNEIVINANQTGTPSLNAFIVIDRGDEDDVAIRWNESSNAWQFTNDGTIYQSFGAGGGSSASSVSSNPPMDPELNQVWQDLDTGRIYIFNGTAWVEVQQNGSLGLLRYLGASDTSPTMSIDGSDLGVGEVYFDTTFNVMKVYDGTGWEDAFTAGSLSVSRWIYTASGGETTLSGDDDNDVALSYTPGIEEVYLNGVKLIRTSDYLATDGEEITLEPLVAGSVVEVISYSGFTVADTYTKSEVDDLIQKQGVRWTKVAGSGTSITTLSGSDDYANTLAYTPGTEQVFVNGILIVRGVDYTATDGTSVVLNTALTPGDVVEIIGNSAFSIANTYTKAEIDAKDADIMVFALSDEFSNLTTGTSRVTFRAPFGMTLTQIPRASLSTSSSSGLPTVDINVNGTSILGANKLSIDVNEKTSVTATTPTTLSTTGISDDSEITFDIDVAGTGAKGLKVVLYYKRA
jgi:hypothetical protein